MGKTIKQMEITNSQKFEKEVSIELASPCSLCGITGKKMKLTDYPSSSRPTEPKQQICPCPPDCALNKCKANMSCDMKCRDCQVKCREKQACMTKCDSENPQCASTKPQCASAKSQCASVKPQCASAKSQCGESV